MRSASTRLPLAQRIADKSWPDPETGCLVWQGLLGSTGRYGRISVGNRDMYVHRAAWELENGPIPEGLELDHRCRNRACVNTAHLELVTRKENVRRGRLGEVTRERWRAWRIEQGRA